MRFHFGHFSFDAPDDWGDITPEDDHTYPLTLALDDGVGVIQLSRAEWTGGRRPDISVEGLRSLFATYCKNQNIEVEPCSWDNAGVIGVGGRGTLGEDTVGIWYISDGADVVLVTYLGGEPNQASTELECEVAAQMVESAKVEPR